jgi:hypothetical protein
MQGRWHTHLEGNLNLLSELWEITRFQGVWSTDALAVDIGAVGAVQILNEVLCPTPRDASVPARHPRVLQPDVALSMAAYRDRRSADVECPSGARAAGHGQGGC